MSDNRHLVVLTGAGASAESGIPTFRDPNGLWARFNPDIVCTASGLYENPVAVLSFHNVLRGLIAKAEPNAAHLAIAALERIFDVTVITQNVDNLHERAGSTKVIHLHGDATKVTSSKRRLDPECIMDYPLDKPILVGDKAADGSQLRPAVLFMDEYPYSTESAANACKDADLFLVIGTSFSIGTAASLAAKVPQSIPKYLIDPGTPPVEGYIHIQKKAAEGIVDFVDIIAKGRPL